MDSYELGLEGQPISARGMQLHSESYCAISGRRVEDQEKEEKKYKNEPFRLEWLDGYPFTPYWNKVEEKLWQVDGIPNHLRGNLWIKLSRSEGKSEEFYYSLLEKALRSSPAAERISVDVYRSFANDQIRRAIDTPKKRMQLENVLLAFSTFNPRVSYHQGMNFIVAFLLMYMDEARAFWVFANIMEFYGFGLLCRVDLPVLSRYEELFILMLESLNPRVSAHLEQQGYDYSLYLTGWLTTLFAYSLRHDILVKVWDPFLAYGIEIIFRVGLALFSMPPLLTPNFFDMNLEMLSEHFKTALLNVDTKMLLQRIRQVNLPKSVLQWLVYVDDGVQFEAH